MLKKSVLGLISFLLVFFILFGSMPVSFAENNIGSAFNIDPSVLADPDTMYAEGMKYFSGDGVEQDIAKGCALIHTAANEGSQAAILQMGYLYAYGFGPVFDKDFDENSSPAIALEWFQRSAESGDSLSVAYSMIEIGYDYLLGRNDNISENTVAAIMFFEEAEKLGVYSANATLGIFYTYGAIVNRDPDRALDLFLEGARDGYKECEYSIEEYAYAYYSGRDESIDINFGTSFQYYNALTEFGNTRAMYNIGLLYIYGLGVSPDREKGLRWISKAAGEGEAQAQAFLDDLAAAESNS